jgi:hypothetical protein
MGLMKRRDRGLYPWAMTSLVFLMANAAGCHKKKDAKDEDQFIFVERGLSLPDLSGVTSVTLSDTSLLELDLSLEPPVARHSWTNATSHSAATESCSKEVILDIDRATVLEYFNGLELCVATPRRLVSHCSGTSFSLTYAAAPDTRLLTIDGKTIAAYFEPVECEAEFNVLCSASRLKELEAAIKEKVGPFSAENCTKS